MSKSAATKAKEKAAKRKLEMREAWESAVLKDLKSSDAGERRASAKLYADDISKQLEQIQDELDALKSAPKEDTVLRAELDAVTARAETSERELKAWQSALAVESKKVLSAVNAKEAAIAQREATVSRREKQMETSNDGQLTLQAFTAFWKMPRICRPGSS
jgi:hypothetical protein